MYSLLLLVVLLYITVDGYKLCRRAIRRPRPWQWNSQVQSGPSSTWWRSTTPGVAATGRRTRCSQSGRRRTPVRGVWTGQSFHARPRRSPVRWWTQPAVVAARRCAAGGPLDGRLASRFRRLHERPGGRLDPHQPGSSRAWPGGDGAYRPLPGAGHVPVFQSSVPSQRPLYRRLDALHLRLYDDGLPRYSLPTR